MNIVDRVKTVVAGVAAKTMIKTSIGQSLTKKAIEKFMVANQIPGSVTTPTADDHKWVVELGSPEGEAYIVVQASEDLICQIIELAVAQHTGDESRSEEITKQLTEKLLTR